MDFSVEGFDACLLGQGDEFGDRAGTKLFHDPAAVYFDGFFCDLQFEGDLLVQHTRNDVTKNFIFARS